MSRQDENWSWIERGDNSRIVTVETDVTIATGMNFEDVKHIVDLHNRELNFKSRLKSTYVDLHPFVIETLKRDGEPPRYRVSREGIGGCYSDEFDKRENADFVRHTMTREEAGKEQLRYRVWQLERELRWALGELHSRYEEPYDEDAPERAQYNKAKAMLTGESS